MKKIAALIAVAGLATVAACSAPAEEAATEADTTAVAEDAMATEEAPAEDAMAAEGAAEGDAMAAEEAPAEEAAAE